MKSTNLILWNETLAKFNSIDYTYWSLNIIEQIGLNTFYPLNLWCVLRFAPLIFKTQHFAL